MLPRDHQPGAPGRLATTSGCPGPKAFRPVAGLLLLVIVGLSGPGTATAAAWLGPRKPNVVVIVADDLGYADVGFHGCRDIPTPHLDSLARSGVRFTDGYASSPVCSPTRAGLLTGRYPQRFGFGDGGFLAPGQELPPSEASLAELLGAAGYVT